MKKNTLLKPLVSSVLILVLFSLLIYLSTGSTEATPWATFWSSLGTIVIGVLRTIQWLIAMALALLICLAFLFAIFFGAVALFDREVSATMFHNFKAFLLSQLLPFTGECCRPSVQLSQEATETAADQEQYKALHTEINNAQEHLHTTQQVLADKINLLTSRIENLEAMTADMANTQQLDDMSNKVQSAVDSLSGIQNAVSAMQSSVDQTASQLKETSPDNILGNLPQRVQALEEQQTATEAPEPVDIIPLQNDIKAMQNELTQFKKKAGKALPATDNATPSAVQEAPKSTPKPAASAPPVEQTAVSENDVEEHRIFNYFDEPADREKLVELVSSTLEKDMSYKQVLNFLVKEFGPDKGKIISSHPSLSKDYIRQCRKNH